MQTRRNGIAALVAYGVLAAGMLLPTEARALGIGSSLAFGFGEGINGFPPSFDLVIDPATVQIHALQTIDAAFDDQLYLGANAYFEVEIAPIAEPWYATVQPGFSLDLIGDPTTVIIAGEARLGIVADNDAGFGVYVVPALGIAASDGESELLAGGTLQVSVWFDL
jgi:hypothetical protein